VQIAQFWQQQTNNLMKGRLPSVLARIDHFFAAVRSILELIYASK